MSQSQLEQITHYESEDEVPYVIKRPFYANGLMSVSYAKIRKTHTDNPSACTEFSYVQKTLVLSHDSNIDVAKRQFIKEVKILRQARHHHAIEIIEAYQLEQENDHSELAIIMPRADCDLSKYLTKKVWSAQDRKQLHKWFHCLASAVDYIHGIGIRHRDIKPTNILVSKGNIQLADFGISSMGLVITLSTTLPGIPRPRTPTHCAPEVEDGSSRGKSADIFSLGAVFLEMLVAHSHLERRAELVNTRNFNGSPSYARKINDIHEWINSFSGSMQSSEWDYKILSICQKMLHEDRDERPHAVQVLRDFQTLFSPLNTSDATCNCVSFESMGKEASLVEACKSASLNRVRDMLDADANSSTIGALHQASARGKLEIVTCLMEYGAQIDLRDHSDQTALHCATGCGHGEVVQFLLQHNAAIDVLDSERRTPIHYAAGCGRSSILRQLLDKAKDNGMATTVIEAVDSNGQTALHFAAKRGHTNRAGWLLQGLPDESKAGYINRADEKGRTAIHFAAGCGCVELTRWLLDHDARPNASDNKKRTPLHFAALGRRSTGDYKGTVELLIERGVDVLKLDYQGDTAFRLAEGKAQIQQMLATAKEKQMAVDVFENSLASSAQSNDKLTGNLIAQFHPDFVSFMTIAQFLQVNLFPIEWKWNSHFDPLGHGATGDVRQFRVNSNLLYAFKRFTTLRQRSVSAILPEGFTSLDYVDTGGLYTALISELVILCQSEVREHKHIIDILGIGFDVEDSGQETAEIWPILILDSAPHGSLKRYMASASSEAMDVPSRLRLCAQIGSAMSTMHSNNIVHGDLKPQNVLIFDDSDGLTAKLTDFSYSCFGKSDEGIIRMPRSVPWHAPEYKPTDITIRDAKLMDVYSFGMLSFWLLFPDDFDNMAQNLSNESSGKSYAHVQTIAKTLASDLDLLDTSIRQSLVEFFDITMSVNPEKRCQRNWQDLVKLLGHNLWQLSDKHRQRGITQRKNLASFDTTAQDIRDPEKLRILTLKILNSVTLVGSEYNSMRQHLDSSRWTEEMRTEEYINGFLERLSLFRVPSIATTNDDIVKGLKHECLSVTRALHEFTKFDFRIRVHLAKCLEKRALDPLCEPCTRSAAPEIAFCYLLGFGVPSDERVAREWQTRTTAPFEDLQERLDYLRRSTITNDDMLADYGPRSVKFFHPLVFSRYGDNCLNSAENYLLREISDFEKALGSGHWQTFQLRIELVELLSTQGRKVEATQESIALERSMREKYGRLHIFHTRASILLAESYVQQNRWKEAEDKLLEAKAAAIEELGSDHLWSLRLRGILAKAFLKQGKYQEAEDEFEFISRIAETNEIARHFYSTGVVVWHFELLHKQGKFERAEEVLMWHTNERNMSRKVAKLVNYHQVGYFALQRGEFSLAEDILADVKRQAGDLEDTVEETESGEVLEISMMAQRNLALAIRNQNRLEEAEELQRNLKARREAIDAQPSKETLNVAFDLARTLQMQEKWNEAAVLQTKIKEERRFLLGLYDEDTLLCSLRLFEIFKAQKKFENARNELNILQAAKIAKGKVARFK